MVKLGLLLIVLGSLGIFVVQNMTPMLTLTILGMQTPALPLALWILGAIAAGVLTAWATGVLLQLGSRRRVASPGRSRGSRAGRRGTSGTPWTPPSWAQRSAEPQDAPRRAKPSPNPSREEDWSGASAADDWDDWANAQEHPRAAGRPPAQPPIRDAEFRPLDVETLYPEPEDTPAYGAAYGYGAVADHSSPYQPSDSDPRDYGEDPEVWDEWEAEEERRRSQPPPPPPEPEAPPARDIVEIRRDPQTTQRTGTIYSFSYRQEESPELDATDPAPASTPEPPMVQPDAVVTATPAGMAPAAEPEPRIRVIIPPYRPLSPTPPVTDADPSTPDLEVEDWDGDDDQDLRDVPSHAPDHSGDREVWDDWEEDSDEPDGPPAGGNSPRSPQGNPPLQF